MKLSPRSILFAFLFAFVFSPNLAKAEITTEFLGRLEVGSDKILDSDSNALYREKLPNGGLDFGVRAIIHRQYAVWLLFNPSSPSAAIDLDSKTKMGRVDVALNGRMIINPDFLFGGYLGVECLFPYTYKKPLEYLLNAEEHIYKGHLGVDFIILPLLSKISYPLQITVDGHYTRGDSSNPLSRWLVAYDQGGITLRIAAEYSQYMKAFGIGYYCYHGGKIEDKSTIQHNAGGGIGGEARLTTHLAIRGQATWDYQSSWHLNIMCRIDGLGGQNPADNSLQSYLKRDIPRHVGPIIFLRELGDGSDKTIGDGTGENSVDLGQDKFDNEKKMDTMGDDPTSGFSQPNLQLHDSSIIQGTLAEEYIATLNSLQGQQYGWALPKRVQNLNAERLKKTMRDLLAVYFEGVELQPRSSLAQEECSWESLLLDASTSLSYYLNYPEKRKAFQKKYPHLSWPHLTEVFESVEAFIPRERSVQSFGNKVFNLRQKRVKPFIRFSEDNTAVNVLENLFKEHFLSASSMSHANMLALLLSHRAAFFPETLGQLHTIQQTYPHLEQDARHQLKRLQGMSDPMPALSGVASPANTSRGSALTSVPLKIKQTAASSTSKTSSGGTGSSKSIPRITGASMQGKNDRRSVPIAPLSIQGLQNVAPIMFEGPEIQRSYQRVFPTTHSVQVPVEYKRLITESNSDLPFIKQDPRMLLPAGDPQAGTGVQESETGRQEELIQTPLTMQDGGKKDSISSKIGSHPHSRTVKYDSSEETSEYDEKRSSRGRSPNRKKPVTHQERTPSRHQRKKSVKRTHTGDERGVSPVKKTTPHAARSGAILHKYKKEAPHWEDSDEFLTLDTILALPEVNAESSMDWQEVLRLIHDIKDRWMNEGKMRQDEKRPGVLIGFINENNQWLSEEEALQMPKINQAYAIRCLMEPGVIQCLKAAKESIKKELKSMYCRHGMDVTQIKSDTSTHELYDALCAKYDGAKDDFLDKEKDTLEKASLILEKLAESAEQTKDSRRRSSSKSRDRSGSRESTRRKHRRKPTPHPEKRRASTSVAPVATDQSPQISASSSSSEVVLPITSLQDASNEASIEPITTLPRKHLLEESEFRGKGKIAKPSETENEASSSSNESEVSATTTMQAPSNQQAESSHDRQPFSLSEILEFSVVLPRAPGLDWESLWRRETKSALREIEASLKAAGIFDSEGKYYHEDIIREAMQLKKKPPRGFDSTVVSKINDHYQVYTMHVLSQDYKGIKAKAKAEYQKVFGGTDHRPHKVSSIIQKVLDHKNVESLLTSEKINYLKEEQGKAKEIEARLPSEHKSHSRRKRHRSGKGQSGSSIFSGKSNKSKNSLA